MPKMKRRNPVVFRPPSITVVYKTRIRWGHG